MNKTKNVQEIITVLANAAEQTPELEPFYRFHRKLLQAQSDTAQDIQGSLGLKDKDALVARQREGQPLLSFAQLPIEEDDFAQLALNIAHNLVEYKTELSEELEGLAQVDWLALAKTRFAQEMAAQVAAEATTSEDMGLAEATASLALQPYLQWAAAQLGSHVEQENWKRGYCPICGAVPHFAYLDDDAGARYLVCSRCAFEWLYDRVGCPFCGNKDHEQLRYYPAGDKKEYRLYVCDACQRYLKAIDLRQARKKVLLAAEPILTVPLDLAAKEQGYR